MLVVVYVVVVELYVKYIPNVRSYVLVFMITQNRLQVLDCVCVLFGERRVL